jgi:DNA-binding NarL/FixJ family response regulator
MPRFSATPLILTRDQEEALRKLAHAHMTPCKLAERVEIILRSAAETPVREIARELNIWPKTVRRWRAEWLASAVEACCR